MSHAPVVTRGEAARREAVVAVLLAAVTLALLACLSELVPAVRDSAQYLVEPFAGALVGNMQGDHPILVAAVLLFVAEVTGAALGLMARRLRLRVIPRVVVLALAVLPALWIGLAMTLMFVWVPRLMTLEAKKLMTAPVGALWFAGIGVIFASPVLAAPAIFAALLLEGWTRPEALPQTGLARPKARRWLLRGLGAAATAFTTFAALNWWRVGATP
jgi:hypothetical protein